MHYERVQQFYLLSSSWLVVSSKPQLRHFFLGRELIFGRVINRLLLSCFKTVGCKPQNSSHVAISFAIKSSTPRSSYQHRTYHQVIVSMYSLLLFYKLIEISALCTYFIIYNLKFYGLFVSFSEKLSLLSFETS